MKRRVKYQKARGTKGYSDTFSSVKQGRRERMGPGKMHYDRNPGIERLVWETGLISSESGLLLKGEVGGDLRTCQRAV